VYGLLGPASALLDTDASVSGGVGQRKLSGGPDASKKRNIYVSPPKKGTFGFPYQDRTIGGTRMDFVPDEFER
jgi:hypothetical protein